MVLMAAASDDHRHHDHHHHHHRRRHHRAAKRSPTPPPPQPQPESPSPSPAPLDCFSFTWGVRRRLRCSKDGAPVVATALTSPPQHPATPSPDKEKPAQGDAAAGSSSRPQRSRHLRPLRYPASRSTDAGAVQALHSPASAPPPPLTEPQPPRKRGFAVALTKQEIALDFAAVRCKRPPRRGKKRSKAQQAKIDALCPGFFLSTVDLDNYKIDDNNNR